MSVYEKHLQWYAEGVDCDNVFSLADRYREVHGRDLFDDLDRIERRASRAPAPPRFNHNPPPPPDPSLDEGWWAAIMKDGEHNG